VRAAQPIALTGLILAAGMTIVCQRGNHIAECDCSTFPPKQGCDTTCGIATGIVESVTSDSVTIKVPVIQTAPANSVPNYGPAESAAIQRGTFAVSGVDPAQLANIKPGSRVAFTFQQEQGRQVLKSIQPIQTIPRGVVPQ